MEPVLVFLGVATLVGLLIRVVVRQRLRAAAGQPDASEEQVCQLEQASRITSVTVVASLVALTVAVLAFLIL